MQRWLAATPLRTGNLTICRWVRWLASQGGDSLGGDALTDNVCSVHTLADGDFSVLVVRCQYAVPTASAPLWADAVMKAVQPER